MLHKTYSLLDAKADGDTGTFEATVAVFGNVDKGGDRIMPGAFKNTLAKWADSGDPIPVILSHQWDNPMAHIGVVQEAKETDAGLWVKGTLDVADNDVARQVHRLMKRRSLKEFSFGYEVPDGGERRAKDGANDLTEISLAEVGPTLKGMNPATELHAVKTALAEVQAGQIGGKVGLGFTAKAEESTELQEVKARLEKIEKALETLAKKADPTDQEPSEAHRADPLRKQADDVELRFASNGMSLEKPPPVAPQAPPPDLDDLDVLKQRMRDDMLIHLNGDIE